MSSQIASDMSTLALYNCMVTFDALIISYDISAFVCPRYVVRFVADSVVVC